MSTFEKERENLETQVCELETLQSVYPKELIVTDHGVLADINDFIAGNTADIPQKLEYTVEIGASLPLGTIELEVVLPTNYPTVDPEVYARSMLLNREQQQSLNEELTKFVKCQEKGEPCIYSIISWLQDNLDRYLTKKKGSIDDGNKRRKKKAEDEKKDSFVRYWVYSHHIYSKLKRKDIASIAKENSLTGFCLAGKPGIVCVEGAYADCEYWWQQVKVMNWHRILVKFVEEEDLDRTTNIDALRKFPEFQEVSFATSERHNDMGQLFKYLMEHQSQQAFKELFGVEGKPSQLTSV